MTKYPDRNIVIVIDFDGDVDRLKGLHDRIPSELEDRVFILGIASNAEDLKRAFGVSFENIGKNLAIDCHEDSTKFWGHELLEVNALEVSRLREYIDPILFGPD